jgi:hypothetical protein
MPAGLASEFNVCGLIVYTYPGSMKQPKELCAPT